MTTSKIKKNKSIKAWLHQHVNDAYVNQAQKDGYRSRAAYKLLAIAEQDNLFQGVRTVVDLGCAPGSWSQVSLAKVARVIGVDLLPIAALARLQFIQGDFTTEATLKQLLELIGSQPVDLLLSDMSPNLSGIKDVDQARSAYLTELVLDFAREHLRAEGNCLIKAFHGGEFDQLVQQARKLFTQVVIRKPLASRSGSSEIYLLCKRKKTM